VGLESVTHAPSGVLEPRVETLRESGPEHLYARLRGAGVRYGIGPFVVALRGGDRRFAARLHAHYPAYPLVAASEFADATLTLTRNPSLSRHWWSTRAIRLEDEQVFTTFPEQAALAHLEWTLNWAIANRAHAWLMLHAGVLARPEGALILPAAPGAGKSTLCAYLMHRGWRLLSDEFTLLRDESLAIHPFPRLLPIKNASIAVLRQCIPEARFGPEIPGTHKGTVAHLQPPDEAIARMHETALPRLMIFPRYVAGSPLEISPVPRAQCFVEITQNAFNYVLKGETGFRLAAALTERVSAFQLHYSDLEAAAVAINDLMAEASASSP
jgi:HprK-related kinase A